VNNGVFLRQFSRGLFSPSSEKLPRVGAKRALSQLPSLSQNNSRQSKRLHPSKLNSRYMQSTISENLDRFSKKPPKLQLTQTSKKHHKTVTTQNRLVLISMFRTILIHEVYNRTINCMVLTHNFSTTPVVLPQYVIPHPANLVHNNNDYVRQFAIVDEV